MFKIISTLRTSPKLLGVLLGSFCAISWAACATPPSLSLNEELAQKIWQSPVKDKLHRSGVAQYTMHCDADLGRFIGTFQYYEVDGRENTTVVSDTTCDTPGPVLSWEYESGRGARIPDYNEVRSVGNGTSALAVDEILHQMTLGGIGPNPRVWERSDVEAHLREKFTALTSWRLEYANVVCKKAGTFYEASYRYELGDYRRSTLGVRCHAAGQNFSLYDFQYLGAGLDGQPLKLGRLRVREYAPVPSEIIERVYAELTRQTN